MQGRKLKETFNQSYLLCMCAVSNKGLSMPNQTPGIIPGISVKICLHPLTLYGLG